MRKKIIVIVICLLVAALMTVLITNNANKKYKEISKDIDIYVATEFIPMGTTVHPEMFKKIKVQEAVAKKLKMLTDISKIEGKTLTSHALEGNPIYSNQISKKTTSSGSGYKKVGLAVTQPSSDQAVAGDRVDIYPVLSAEGNFLAVARALVEDAYVVASYDQGGRIIAPTTDTKSLNENRVPTMVEVEVPDDKVAEVVSYAAKKQIYLVRR